MVTILRFISFVSLCLASFTCQAQYFNKNYEISGDKDFFSTPVYYDSAVYVDGHFRIGSSVSGNLITKINLSGDTIFVRKFVRDSTIFFGSYGTSLILFKNSLYSIGVYTKTSPLVNIAYVQKFNLNGDSLDYYEMIDSLGVVFNGIAITQDDNLIVTGYVRPTSANFDVLLVKFDTLLNPIWSQTYGGSNIEAGMNVDTSSDGGFVIGGYTKSYGAGQNDAYLIKTDVAGNFQWQRTCGGIYDDMGWVKVFDNDEIILYGAIEQNLVTVTSDSDCKLFIRKYNNAGTLQSENLNITHYCSLVPLTTLIRDNSSYYFCSYYFKDTMSSYVPVANIVKSDLNGNLLYARDFTLSTLANYSTSMIMLPDKSLLTTGYLFADGITIMTEDAWLFRVDSMGCFIPNCWLGINQIIHENLSVNIFPNPTNGQFIIKIDSPFENKIVILDALGQIVFETTIKSTTVNISLNPTLKGLYFIQLTDTYGKSSIQKILLQ